MRGAYLITDDSPDALPVDESGACSTKVSAQRIDRLDDAVKDPEAPRDTEYCLEAHRRVAVLQLPERGA